MKALIYLGNGKKAIEERPKPSLIHPNDAIVKVTKTTICATDLHILHGDIKTCEPGCILGHEGVGIVEKIGANVTSFSPGDRVVISCISACNKCEYCHKGMYSHCSNAGWLLGNTIDGTQAEYVRVPYADTSLYKIPSCISDDAAVMLSDVLPSGYECGVLNGKIQPGHTVAIIGAGPIGLSTLLTASFFSPSVIILVDIDDHRLQVAKQLGATHIINANQENPHEKIMQLTQQRGVDTAIEAVGSPETFLLCENIIAPGGTIANIGIHSGKVDLHMEMLWQQNICITTRKVDTATTGLLLNCVATHKIDPSALISHHFSFKDILKAYDTFLHADKNQALKVIITP